MLPVPRLSVILPSFNQGSFLSQSLDSIFAQSFTDFEVIVVDGGSSDTTVEVLEAQSQIHKNLRWISEADNGVADAVNKGLSMANGEIAAIQSTDDIYYPEAFQQAISYLQSHPDVGIVCADIDMIDQKSQKLWMPKSRHFSIPNLLCRNTIIHQSSTFFRRTLASDEGGWNSDYFCCDTELWLRLAYKTKIVKLDHVWSAWRRHENQRDKAVLSMWQDWRRMIAQSADVQNSPLHHRLAAAAGCRLMALSYAPVHSRFFLLRQLWLALMLYPPCFLGIHPKSVLIPGLGRLLQLFKLNPR